MPDIPELEDDEKCATCSHTYAWHKEHKPVHPFNTGSAGAKAFLGARRGRDPRTGPKTSQRGAERPQTIAAPWPMDPVLRMALVDAGVITPAQLRAAEDKIRAVSAEFNGGAGDGQSPEGTRWREVQ
jgi:hypothetical protein